MDLVDLRDDRLRNEVNKARPWCWSVVLLTAGFTFLVSLFSIQTARADPVKILKSGTMSDLIEQVIDTYESNGISWQHWIDWEIQPFTTTYWYYNRFENLIVVGEFPHKGQIEDYWQAWSEALTDGNWNPEPFFTSPTDAFEMARFNQFVLATHESAHAITTRYDPDHRDRHDHDINCREYYADRLTAIIVQEHARKSLDFARWTKRYRELVISMHDAIPDEYLVQKADQPSLEKNCAIIEVEQPTPDKLQAYASAYFTRWEALLDVNLPPLDEAFDTHLRERLTAQFAVYPKAHEWRNGTLETQGEFDEVYSHFSYGSKLITGGRRRVAFDETGRLWFAEAAISVGSDQHELLIGFAGSGVADHRIDLNWPANVEKMWLNGIVVVSDKEIYALFGDDDVSSIVVKLVRANEDWSQTIIGRWPNTGNSQIFRTAGNKIIVGLTSFYDPEEDDFDDSRWELYFVDRQTGQKRMASEIPTKINRLVSADDDGRLYGAGSRILWRYEPGSGFIHVAGSGLWGARNGSTFEAEISSVHAMQILSDGSAIILMDIPGKQGRQVFRRLMP